MESIEPSWRIEATCHRAWPAREELVEGAWLMRCSGGQSRRINSANPLRGEVGDGADVIPRAEDFYRERGQRALFRIPSLLDPAIDRALDRRGYTLEGETLTLFGAVTTGTKDAEVIVSSHPDTAWLAAIARLQDLTREQSDIYRGIVALLTLPAAFAALRADGELVSLAFAVLDDGLMCFESVATDRRYRGRGYSRRVLKALLAWGAARGAEAACLQVLATNAPALAVYRRLGLTAEPYRYHYRRQASEL